MSLPELNAAVAGATGIAWLGNPISRCDLGALMQRYPDANNKQEN